MKSLLIALTLVCGTLAMANEPAKEAAPAAPAAAVEAKHEVKMEEATGKMSKKDATAACKKEYKKAAEIKKCVEEKTM